MCSSGKIGVNKYISSFPTKSEICETNFLIKYSIIFLLISLISLKEYCTVNSFFP